MEEISNGCPLRFSHWFLLFLIHDVDCLPCPQITRKKKGVGGDSNKRRTKILINIEKQKNFEGWASCYAQLSSVYLKSKREQRCHSSTHTTLRIRIFLRFSLHFLIELEFFDLFSVCLMHFDVRCTGCVARFRLSVSNDRVDRTWPVYCDLINYGRWLIDPAICSTQFWLGWVGGFRGRQFHVHPSHVRICYGDSHIFFGKTKNKKMFWLCRLSPGYRKNNRGILLSFRQLFKFEKREPTYGLICK